MVRGRQPTPSQVDIRHTQRGTHELVNADIHVVGLICNATGEQARLVKTVKVSAAHGSGAGIRPSVASEGLISSTD